MLSCPVLAKIGPSLVLADVQGFGCITQRSVAIRSFLSILAGDRLTVALIPAVFPAAAADIIRELCSMARRGLQLAVVPAVLAVAAGVGGPPQKPPPQPAPFLPLARFPPRGPGGPPRVPRQP